MSKNGFWSVPIILLLQLCACGPKIMVEEEAVSSSPAAIQARPLDRSQWTWVDRQGGIRTYQQTLDKLQRIVSDHGVLGISVALKQGRDWNSNPHVFFFDLGFEDLRNERQISARKVFRADRLGQTLIAYLVLKLATEGQIDMDRPLSKYVSRSAVYHSAYKEIAGDRRYPQLTARRILSHQSGLSNSLRDDNVKRPVFVSTPGKGYVYSDEGYRFLQFILEEMLGKPFDELAQTYIYGSFGMNQTSFSRPAYSDDSDPAASWAFTTTASDFTRFMWSVRLENPYLSREAFMSYIVYPTVSIHSPSIMESGPSKVKTNLPSKLGWCLGWGTYQMPRVILRACSFMGQKDQGIEAYATVFESPHSTALTIFVIPSLSRSFMPQILRGLLGEMESPLSWLGF